MIKSGTDTEARYRSLLQKAVRRGNADLVYTASALLASLSPKERKKLVPYPYRHHYL